VLGVYQFELQRPRNPARDLDLSRITGSFVIARNTAFTYKGKTVDARQIGREVGVRYVLEGSVRRSSGEVRVNAQLVDAETGALLWTERLDRGMDDLFRLQNAISSEIGSGRFAGGRGAVGPGMAVPATACT
jgi:TolB-like protein